MATAMESTIPALSVADARLLLRSKDALTTLARKKDALGALAERLYPDAANPTHSLAHDLFPDTFGPPDDYRPPLSPRLDDDGASLDDGEVGSAATADADEEEEEDDDAEDGEEAEEEVFTLSAKARAKRKAVEPNPPSTGMWPRVAAEDLTEEERERRRKKRQRNLAVKRLDIQSQADRLAKLLALGEVPKVRPYGKEGFMSLSVTHEMFAIDEAYAPLSSPNPKPVSSNPVWSSFAAAYLLPTVSAFLACPTPWSDYAATLHACERTVYWSKFCEGGGPGNEKERAARRRHNGLGGVAGAGGEEGELPGLGKEWGMGCAEMATVQARRMVEWPFDPRKTSDGTWFLSACSFLSVLLCWSRKAPSVVIGPYLARQLTHRIKSLLAVSTPASSTATPKSSPTLARTASSGTPSVATTPTTTTTSGKAGVLSHPYDKPMLERLISFLPLPEPLGRDAAGFGREATCCAREGCHRSFDDADGEADDGTSPASSSDERGSGSSPCSPTLGATTGGLNGDHAGGRKVKKERKMKQCSRCRSVVYCSKEHQVEDWRRRHREHCWPTGITGTASHFASFGPPLTEGSADGEEEDGGEDEGEGTETGTGLGGSSSYISSPTSSFSNDLALPAPAAEDGAPNGSSAGKKASKKRKSKQKR